MKNVSATQTANANGVKIGAYSTYETGRSVPRLETMINLSKYFGVSIDDLLHRDLESEGLPLPSESATPPPEILALLTRLNSQLEETERKLLTALTPEGRLQLENYLEEVIRRHPDLAENLNLK